MLIEPVYPDVYSDKRLLSVEGEMTRIAALINDAEWEGRDATDLKERWKVFQERQARGIHFVANF